MRNDISSYFEEPDFKELLMKYEGMVKNHTPIYFDTDELIDLADYYILIRKEKEADEVIDYSLQLHPNNTDALIFKIRSSFYYGYKEKARELFNRLEDPTDREVMFLKAEMLIDEKKYMEAESIYQELAQAEDESPQILRDIVTCYMDVNNKEYARKWLSKIEEKGYNQENSQLFRDLWSDYCMIFDRPEDAEKALKISVDEHPYSIKYWNELAKCYLAQFRIEEAHEAIEFSLAIDEDYLETMELKAYCYTQEDNFEAALTIYKQIFPKFCENRERIYAHLAQCYVNLEQFHHAVDCYKEWLAEDPQITNYEKAEIYRAISNCYCRMNNMEEGMLYIDLSLEIDPYQFDSIMHKASILLNIGDYLSANCTFQKVEEICPEDELEDLYYTIIISYLYYKQFNSVIEWGKKGINIFPESMKKWAVPLAYSFYQIDDRLNGSAFLKEAIELHKAHQLDKDASQMLHALMTEIQQGIN